LGVIQPRFPFVGVEVLTTYWFWWPHIDPDSLESKLNSLKTRMTAWFRKKFQRKNWLITLAFRAA